MMLHVIRRTSSVAHVSSPSISGLQSSVSVLLRSFSSTADKEYLIINAIGTDRPGIVAEVTKRVTDAGGNVGESQAAQLGLHFGLMMLVSVPKGECDSLQTSLRNIQGINTSCFATGDPKSVEVTPQIGYSGHFSLSGADHPGIVYKVASILANHRLSIDMLKTSEEDSPFGGTTLFIMDGIANAREPLTKGFDPNSIREELIELGDEMNCDITFENVSESSSPYSSTS